MRLKLFVPILVLAVLVISGCSSPINTPTEDFGGLSVSFSTTPSTTTPNSPVRLELGIKNQADAEITDITANVIGQASLQPFTRKLLREREEDSYIWEQGLRAHENEIPMSFLLRLKYNYKSVGSATIPIVSQSEAKVRQDQGSSFPTGSQHSRTGPISLSFKAPNYVIGGNEFQIEADLNNIGKGDVCSGNCFEKPDKTIKLKIKFDSNALTAVDCNNVEEIQLIKSNSVICKFKANGFTGSPIVNTDITFETDIEYWVEKTATVEVKKPRV